MELSDKQPMVKLETENRLRSSLHAANTLLAALPAYVNVTLTLYGVNEDTQVRLLTRDLPATGRRLTNLDSGREWFLPLSDELTVLRVEISPLTLEVTY